MSQAIENRFNIDATDLSETLGTYHSAELNRLLPDGCCWVVHLDGEETIKTIEATALAELPGCAHMAREGSFVTTRDDEPLANVHILMAPLVEQLEKLHGEKL
ncbi:hypothetical protein LOC71_22145 [Rhodopirellula sp. JC740]|uniref:Uncharacterized protein n=1 Tax=Rhodopirellula halodulae TaxID=2894198 RepID=A0ABS8NN66_9BACT|nr:hypothetical protein [Rhodopirellula sp. JC740]MCC9644987.1 hypothetical protein [Rhodopirellula sp. JC740]